jgi:hypothetical protein
VFARLVEDGDENPWLNPLFLKTYQENLRTGAHYRSTLAVGEEGFFNADTKGGKEPYIFELKFSDGVILTAQNATRSFDSPGRYDVRLTVRDADGQRIGSDLFVNVVSEKPKEEATTQSSTTISAQQH